MCASGPTARATLTLFEFFLRPTNPSLTGDVLFRVVHPTDELIASERCDVLPRIKCMSVGNQGTAQIGWKFVDHPAGYSLIAHRRTLPMGSNVCADSELVVRDRSTTHWVDAAPCSKSSAPFSEVSRGRIDRIVWVSTSPPCNEANVAIDSASGLAYGFNAPASRIRRRPS